MSIWVYDHEIEPVAAESSFGAAELAEDRISLRCQASARSRARGSWGRAALFLVNTGTKLGSPSGGMGVPGGELEVCFVDERRGVKGLIGAARPDSPGEAAQPVVDQGEELVERAGGARVDGRRPLEVCFGLGFLHGANLLRCPGGSQQVHCQNPPRTSRDDSTRRRRAGVLRARAARVEGRGGTPVAPRVCGRRRVVGAGLVPRRTMPRSSGPSRVGLGCPDSPAE